MDSKILDIFFKSSSHHHIISLFFCKLLRWGQGVHKNKEEYYTQTYHPKWAFHFQNKEFDFFFHLGNCSFVHI